MSLEDLKRQIEQRTGVPARLLNGKTVEENIAQAKAILFFKKTTTEDYTKKTGKEPQKSAADKFGEWFNAKYGEGEQDETGAALRELEEIYKAEQPGAGNPWERRNTADLFAEWLDNRINTNKERFPGIPEESEDADY